MMAVQCFLQQAVVFAEGGQYHADRLLRCIMGLLAPCTPRCIPGLDYRGFIFLPL